MNVFKPLVPAIVLLALAPAARAQLVVIVSAKSNLAPVVEQVCQTYLGKLKSPTPINLPEKSPLREDFYKKACSKDAAQVRSALAKLIFTGSGTPPREVGSDGEMKKAIAADPNSVGYLDKKEVDGSVKIVANIN